VRSETALRQNEERLRALVEEPKELHAQREELLTVARAARADAEKANRAKDQFLITLSHELRTPLAPILLWARALRDGTVPPHEMHHAIDAIVLSAESQLQLIEDLRDLSRLESGRMQLEKRSHSVADVARSAIAVIRPTAHAKGVFVELDVTPDLGPAVFDRGRLQQVFWNLLSNSVKFTPEGGNVWLRVRKQDGQLEASVADTGQGIEADFLPHLFQHFRQGHTHERLRYSGLGVGLALCRYLVELHGGTIEGRSEGAGRGAVFIVRMPWIVPDAAAGNDSQDVLVEDKASVSLGGLTVLLVEDDDNMRDIMRWTLEGAGAVVVGVGTGTEALSALNQGPAQRAPDVMICDLGLPGMNGYDLIGRIAEDRRARGARAIPACAVSAFARDEDRTRAIDAGFDSYLAKPMTAQRLIEAVEELAAVAATDLTGTGTGG
jgi:signal transduction histidine kinase/ActR/RegA family two-component response regulator